MRSWSEENKSGTLAFLLTFPVRDYEVVIGKYLAILALLGVALLLTGIMFINLMFVGTNIDYGAVFTGYLGLFLAGAVYASMGLFADIISFCSRITFLSSSIFLFKSSA